jgi:cell shape-determining protein MreC
MKKLLSIVLVAILSLALVVFVGCKRGDKAPVIEHAVEDVIEDVDELVEDVVE